jgi:hypothetical protein
MILAAKRKLSLGVDVKVIFPGLSSATPPVSEYVETLVMFYILSGCNCITALEAD